MKKKIVQLRLEFEFDSVTLQSRVSVHYLDCRLYIYKLRTTYLNTGFPVNVSIIRVLFSIALCTANASWKKCFRFHFKNMTLDWMHLVNSVDLCILSQETVS